MHKRNLGRSGLEVSVVGLGCNNFGARVDFATAKAVIRKALDAGITLFDTADSYGDRGGSETAMGKILGARRKDIVLASKFGLPMDDAGTLKGASRAYIMRAVEASLKRLQTDWLDLYQLHRPDPATPIEETLRALDDLVRSGKVRAIGCSNLSAHQIDEAQACSQRHGLAAFASAQDEYSLLVRDIETALLPTLATHGMGLLPYYPLAGGLLTGKYRQSSMPSEARLTKYKQMAERQLSDRNWTITERLRTFCEQRGRTMLELAMSWMASRPGVSSVIAGATRPEQIDANIAACTWQLTSDDLAEIDRLTKVA